MDQTGDPSEYLFENAFVGSASADGLLPAGRSPSAEADPTKGVAVSSFHHTRVRPNAA